MSDVCDSCWQLRLMTMEALRNGKLHWDELKLVQRQMQLETGVAASMMTQALGLDSPNI